MISAAKFSYPEVQIMAAVGSVWVVGGDIEQAGHHQLLSGHPQLGHLHTLPQLPNSKLVIDVPHKLQNSNLRPVTRLN